MIRYIKLVSGEEIIGELVNESRTDVVLRNPMRMEMVEHHGQYVASLITHCVMTSEVSFQRRFALQLGEASPEFQNAYMMRRQAEELAFSEASQTDEPSINAVETELFNPTLH